MPTIFPKPESVNTKTKARMRYQRGIAEIGERHQKKRFAPSFFPPSEMQRIPMQCSIGTCFLNWRATSLSSGHCRVLQHHYCRALRSEPAQSVF
jgi:hypothetical protein